MVKVNEVDFPIYLMDNVESVRDRIAASFRSLPKYLHFDTELKLSPEDYKINVTDILTILRQYSNKTDFSEIHTTVLPLMNPKLKMKEDIFDVWLAYNTELPKLLGEKNSNMLFLLYNQDAETVLDQKVDIAKFLTDNKANVKHRLETSINTLKNSVREEIVLFSSFESVEDGVNYTKFEVEKASFDLILNISELSLMEIFNRIKLNNTVPFASYNNYYKILKDFVPLPEWAETNDKIIMLRILQRLAPREMSDDHYAYAFILDKEGQTILNINIRPSKLNIDKQDYVNRVFSVLGDIPILSETEDDVKGLFYIPGQSLNKYVFADLIMNNPIFSNFLVIDEHEKLTKVRSEIIVKFKHKKYGLVTANLIEKFRQKGDEITNKDMKIFPMGGRYIRVHVSTSKNIEVVHDFQKILSKLFKLYNNEYTSIVDTYRKYISSFAREKPVKVSQEIEKPVRFKDVAPKDLFKAPVGKKIQFDCNNKPRVVSKAEAEEIEKSGKGTYMLFPKDNEYMTPQYLVCTEHASHPYPGLKENPFPSKDKLPVLPCCFINDQNKPNTVYTKYYNDDGTIIKGASKGQNLITTKKFVGIKQPGTLPENIARFFEIIDPLGTYYRTGMSRTKNSFLECVMDALDIGEFSKDPVNASERMEYVKNERKKLIELAGTGLCRQEIYDSSTEEIQKYVADPEFYLDPSLFIRLLEEMYNCNIFLFTKRIEGGEMSLPRFTQSHLKYKTDNPCIFIYEHMGAASNMAEYPQCELIIKNITKNQSMYSFESTDMVSIKVKRMFNKIRRSYQLKQAIPETVFPLNKNILFETQVIDPSGKCRMLDCKYKGKEVSIIVSPIPPLAIKEVEDIPLRKIDYSAARDMITTLKMTLLKQTIFEGITKELICNYGNVIVTIPINDISHLPGIEKTTKLVFNQNTTSALTVFNYNKKMARYMVEYIFWLFSNYLYDNEIDMISDEDIAKFAEMYITVKPEFVYGEVKKTFSKTGGFMDGGKLVVRSQETLKRLLFVLRLGLVRERRKIMNYYTHNMIENYYLDITDLDHYQSQVILFGDNSVNKWISEKMTGQHRIHNSVIPGFQNPYFFKNPLINDTIYLAQNTTSIEEAYSIYENWIENRYNLGYTAPPGTRVEGLLYSYVNPEKINTYRLPGRATEHTFKVVGYKYTEEDKSVKGFTVLLSL